MHDNFSNIQNFKGTHFTLHIFPEKNNMRYFRANAYVIENDAKLYLIDPSLTLKEYEEILGDNFPQVLLATHSHFDHIYSVNEWINKASLLNKKIDFWAGPDSFLYTNSNENNCSWMLRRSLTFSGANKNFKDEDLLLLGPNLLIRILHFPGHAADLVNFLIYSSQTDLSF